ncbi:MAG: hypothetical protein VCA39_17650 [Pseudomonas sp.]|uniref:hypothetical protein n=1 Tax=Pseudomonas sp. TaxID=306 RepID=UPI003982B725
MSTGLLEQRVNYPNTQYEYGYGAGGSADADGDNRKEIDCSHLLHLMLKDAGYTIPYRSTSQLKTDSTHFDTVALADVQPGDIALWTGASLNHTGVVETIGANHDRGEFFGSQTSTGPMSARFGAGAPFWPMPSQYLRPKPEFRTGTQTAPSAPAPAPAAEPLKVKAKPINWAYPFKTAGESSKEVTDPQLYFDALANAENGFYPMGVNGLWHGGVHFDANTGALLDQSQVRCIADGEVIAYRIDDKYPETAYAATNQPSMGPEPVGAKYSTGFVLVKHRLVLPEPPAPATTGESSGAETAPETPVSATTTPATTATDTPQTTTPAPAATSTEPEGLTFYSLYMHLLDWTSYQAASAPKPPEFLAPSQYSVKPTSDDPLLGLRVRALRDDGTTAVLALLPKGCKVTLGEAHNLKPQFKQLLSVDEGAAIPALPADTIGWVYASELTNNTVADKATDAEPTLALSHQGLRVRQAGNRNGAIIGVLPRGAMLKVGEKQSGGYCKVLEVMDYRGVPALPNGPDGKPLGYVYFDELETQQTAPSDLGLVHLLPEPHAIKAGELIGHIGLYQNQGEGGAKQRLHLEVFSCDDMPAFIAKSRTLAASLPTEQKTLLKIHKGASKLIPHSETITASNPPKINDAGVTIAVELTIPVSVLESLPAERKIQVSETVPGSTTPRITHWWRLDNLLADDAGNRISGWLAEQDMITTRHSPWEWEGFDFISETACAADHLACHLAAQRLLTEEEEPDYQAQISTADHGPIKARLYDIIDGADGSVRDNILSVKEIKATLSKPWHAQSISRLITRYESEWFWKDEKWDELDKLMQHTPEDPNPQWVKEKERIQKLCWWSEMAGKQGINADGKVGHFHTIGLLLNFRQKDPATLNEGHLTYDAEGNDIPSSPYFSRVIHWPGNDLSGVTLGRGYDMGFRSEPEIYNHMISAGVGSAQARKISAANGLKGTSAGDFVTTNKADIGTITVEQQIILFNLIYPDYVSRAKSNYDNWTAEEPTRIDWNNLDQVIRDVLVDFVYQGFTKGPNPMKAGMTNNADTLINYIENTAGISQYEAGRHRATYIRNNR